MNTPGQTRPLLDRTGEELLLLAIAGKTDQRRRIQQELSLRALLAEGARRPRSDEPRSRLRLVRAA